MGFINVAERTINAKLVYYGVGVGGKTTSLQAVHGIMCPRNEVQLVSINTEEDSTLLFDFLPINLGNIGGFKIRIQGFTVPGQPKYKRMRKYVLTGADAVVFVVDSQRSRLQENLDSLQNMRDNLRSAGSATSENIPIVVQYNKRDLDDILSEQELDKHFRYRPDIEAFPSVATDGQGVFEAFVHAAALLVESKVALYGLDRGGASPVDVAAEARAKLWELCDGVRRERRTVATAEQPRTLLSVPDAPSEPPEPSESAGSPKRRTVVEAPLADLLPPALAQDEPPLDYELRDRASSEVLTDADLDVDLSGELIDFSTPPAPQEDQDNALLDKTVQSNLELARRFGELDEYRNLLERKVQEQVEIAQNTVHDLNKPVSAVRLMLSTLRKGYLGELSAPVQQAVDNGLMAVQQMERLIRDLLDSSRLDHDGVTLNFQPVDLTLLVAGVLQHLRFEIDERDAHLRLEPLPVVLADEWALTKVFTNLIGNALQYTAPDRRPVVRIFADDEGDAFVITIVDNGIGIPSRDRDRLFRRFERGSNTGGISGTGLGLHIVKEIIVGHGGTVWLESAEGQGTTFRLRLPKQPVQPEHSIVSETAERADL